MQVAHHVLLFVTPWTVQSMEFSPGQNTGVRSYSLLQGNLRNPGTEPRSPTLILYRLSHQVKPKNTGVGGLCLLQQIFPIQESNWGLLHYRQTLYQLSYQRSPRLRWCYSSPRVSKDDFINIVLDLMMKDC